VYNYADRDMEDTHHRFRTEALYRPLDYRISPILALLRFVKKFILHREGEEHYGSLIFPRKGLFFPKSIVKLPIRSFPRNLPDGYRTIMSKKNFGMAHLVETKLQADSLVRFYFKSKEHVYEILYHLMKRNRRYETPFFCFYGPFVKRGHAIASI
jgi:hypothetical protein